MEATIPAPLVAPASPVDEPLATPHPTLSDELIAPAPPPERLAWGFPIGCGIVAVAMVAFARFVAPPVAPETSDVVITTSNFAFANEPIGEASVLPMPFLSQPIATHDFFAASTPPLRARVRPGAVMVSGRLPVEVVQRILRQNTGRFRRCYEAGLRQNPNLTGRVSTRFVIGRDGGVTMASNGGSDLPDGSVVGCVVRTMYGLSFPQPEGGIVTVTYPVVFSPG